MTTILFPPGFLWGAATSAYQIDGAPWADGKGESIWDRFVRRSGVIANGDTGDVAADHYHRWASDIELMRQLGLDAYRFSIAWTRVQPDGTAVTGAGLDFYDRLVDGLLAAGIEPWPTLDHWDLPQVLEDRGDWPAPETAGRFVDYADVVTRRLCDRVHQWTTMNEPWEMGFLGYHLSPRWTLPALWTVLAASSLHSVVRRSAHRDSSPSQRKEGSCSQSSRARRS